MKRKLLSIYYCWDETGNANSNQNHRQHSALNSMFDSTVVYRKFTDALPPKEFIAVTSPNLLLLDRLFLKTFQSLKLVWSTGIVYWGHKAKKAIDSYGQKIDIVLLTGTPYMLFGMVKKIARQNQAKLVIQMYDPLSMNNYIDSSPKYRKKLEQKIVEQSDLVIIHSKLMYELMCKQYPLSANKLKFVPFCSDPDVTLPQTVSHRNQKVTITHAGNLQNERNIDLLLEAVQNLSPETKAKINIQLIGNTSAKIQNQIHRSGCSDCFELLPFISKDKLYRYFELADVLLAVDSFKDDINIFFPSKVCEYFLFRKPIFLITPQLSETRRVFACSPELCFGQGESAKLSEALQALSEDRHMFDNSLDYSQVEQFAPQNVAGQIAKQINDLF